MNRELLEILACPGCAGDLLADADVETGGRVESGTLRCASCGAAFPIVRHVPRFVPAESYASSFGFQWNRFRTTQLDSHSGLPISRDRFFRESRWTPEELAGKRVLDVGCGAGRFSEVALSAGANVVAVDYSTAVDACYANLGRHPALNVIQADVYHLPFKGESFDYVYCFGVLQHTPDPHRALLALVSPLKRGGRLAVDCYPRLALNVFWPKYWLRSLASRISRRRLFALVEWLVPKLLPLSRAFAAVPVIGRRLRYAVPVMSYYGVFTFSKEQHREWAVLDTFDMLAPLHDHPQNAEAIGAWLREAGLRESAAVREGLVIGRGMK
ncbi:MAG TPA: methyltransferase domain-containing protein [Thermoanaerobaculia bacterium]|nr:methyltransferase domain-containing protein [Thermoanaerobaculia bacterium]